MFLEEGGQYGGLFLTEGGARLDEIEFRGSFLKEDELCCVEVTMGSILFPILFTLMLMAALYQYMFELLKKGYAIVPLVQTFLKHNTFCSFMKHTFCKYLGILVFEGCHRCHIKMKKELGP